MTEAAAPTPTGAEYPFGPMPAHEAAEQYRRIAADRPMTRVTMPFGGDVWVIHRNSAARASSLRSIVQVSGSNRATSGGSGPALP